MISAVAAGAIACDLPVGPEKKSGSNGSVTSTTSTTSTGTTSTSTTGEPPPPPPPVPFCGDGARDEGEDCDDGNEVSLDGCDSSCRFEQVVRFNSLQMQFATSSLCTSNAIGRAIGSAAQETLQSSIATAIGSGSISTLCAFRELRDLTGGNTSATIGCVTGTPSPSSSYNGASDLDWWYRASTRDLDEARVPVARLGATILNRSLSAGPGTIALSLNLGGGSSQLHLSSVLAVAGLGSATTPRAHITLPRGHRVEENLDPELTSFSTLRSGELCGNVSAKSLATLPVPDVLREGGEHACWEGYTSRNSMLDVLAGGCSVFWVSVITATQPDEYDNELPPAGGGAPYQLVANTTTKVIDRCNDSSGRRVTLARCLEAAAYSVAVRFTANRVIITGTEP